MAASREKEIIQYILNNPGKTVAQYTREINSNAITVTKYMRKLGLDTSLKKKYLEGTYINGIYFKKRLKNNKGIFICPFCKKEFITGVSSVGKKLTKSCGCLQRRSSREKTFKNISGQRFGKLIVICPCPPPKDGRELGRGYWYCRCDCGNYKIAKTNSLTGGHVSSCGCSNSHGESIIAGIFQKNGINYEQQKTFDGFVNSNNKKYQFDFYLPGYNCCIEYDGLQHYVGWRHKKDSLEKIKKVDKKKDDYCKNNDIKLVRIPYTDIDKLSLEYLLERVENDKL